jgi:hypothetical protein
MVPFHPLTQLKKTLAAVHEVGCWYNPDPFRAVIGAKLTCRTSIVRSDRGFATVSASCASA